MHGGPVALRLDDVGAASKRHEVYGRTRLRLGPVALPFPGNFLFLKYCPGIRRWGPYRELSAREWEGILGALADAEARMTVAITAAWVERDGRLVPFPAKFPEAAAALREAVRAGRVEVANHGYTHCLLADGRFRPRLFAGNRQFHREFFDWLPEEMHREHLERAQGILQEFFQVPVVTLVPPGNLFSPKTLAAASAVGLRVVSCRDPGRYGDRDGLALVDDADVLALHDRDVVFGGLARFAARLAARPRGSLVTVREVAERAAEPRR
jgi:peptidoglycan/xylan/chitin deacetylase (PgdA/CDA1 family)